MSQRPKEAARFAVENIGGISETEVTIEPGVTVLTGKNATNRTSFLQAIMAAMGSNRATLKGDAEEGRVSLDLAGTSYHRTLTRTNGRVQFGGDPYLEDPEVADLFAFLLESNEARRSVARGDDLRELIMRPVDIDALTSQIEELESQKAEINDELATIESRKRDLPDLEQRRTSLREQIEEKREELAAKEAEIDDHSRNIEETRQEQQALEEKLDDLRSTRSDLQSVRRRIESQEESITSLKNERTSLEAELDDLPDDPVGDQDHLQEEIERLRDRREELNADISDLQSIIEYNEQRLEEEDYELLAEYEGDDVDTPTDRLLADDDIVCWTCGSTVDRGQIEETVDRLRSLREERVAELNDVKDDLEELKADQREARQTQKRREQLEQQLADIEDELDRREERVESLKEQRAELTEEVERLENAVEELESEDFSDVLDLHREANELEFEIDSLESDLEEVTAEIEEIEGRVEEAEQLRADREEIVEELTDLRTKIDQIEEEAVEEFNEHMDAILNILDYANLDRIWIERAERTVQDGREKVQQTVFELHVVRTTENGAAYEDTIAHLSESEREVTGLVFALAGYLVHDLHETVPFMLLDSVEAIDSDRIAALVDYFAEYAEYLVVALLSEDARALDDEYVRIHDI